MRKYAGNQEQVTEVYCNRCGKKLRVENGIVKDSYVSLDILFGYFNKKDGTRHLFDLCEECYDNIASEFTIPVTEIEEQELC